MQYYSRKTLYFGVQSHSGLRVTLASLTLKIFNSSSNLQAQNVETNRRMNYYEQGVVHFNFCTCIYMCVAYKNYIKQNKSSIEHLNIFQTTAMRVHIDIPRALARISKLGVQKKLVGVQRKYPRSPKAMRAKRASRE